MDNQAEDNTQADKAELTALTADIVSAYVGNNPVPATNLPSLIGDVYKALSDANQNADAAHAAAEVKPAVSIRRSLTPDSLTCLECGKRFKSLKRHIRSHHDLSPEQYRSKYSLPSDYPMVAPNYAEVRSALARKAGLGQKSS